MKRKLLIILIALCCVFSFAFALSACGDGNGQEGQQNANGGTPSEHEHDWGEWTVKTEAGCETEGEEIRTCKTDSSHTETRKVDPLDHSYGEWITTTPASCLKEGTETRYCERNQSHFETRSINRNSHTAGKWNFDGINHWNLCAVCGLRLETGKHSYNEDNICKTCSFELIKGTDGLVYELDTATNEYRVTSYDGRETDVVIANYYNGLPVASICNQAFSGLLIEVTSITIPDTVTTIENGAFYCCFSLASINIPDSVTYIGDSAFTYCKSLPSITIPDSVTYIGEYAFYGCESFTSIVIPDGVPSIGNRTFYECYNLESITIGTGISFIGDYAFSGCKSLNAVYIKDIASWCNISYTDFATNPLAYAGNLYLNNELVTTLVIPDGVTAIADNAFYGCSSLTEITIPNSVTSIGNEAFNRCDDLEKVYYAGTAEQWLNIAIGTKNTKLTDAAIYYYSQSNPFVDGVEQGDFWHYDENGEIVVWTKEN